MTGVHIWKGSGVNIPRRLRKGIIDAPAQQASFVNFVTVAQKQYSFVKLSDPNLKVLGLKCLAKNIVSV